MNVMDEFRAACMPRPEVRSGHAFDQLIVDLEKSTPPSRDHSLEQVKSHEALIAYLTNGYWWQDQLRNLAQLLGINDRIYRQLIRRLLGSEAEIVSGGRVARQVVIDELRYLYTAGQLNDHGP